MAGSTYLTRTVAGTGNQKTWTWSGWIKRANVSGLKQILSETYVSGANWANFYIEPAFSGEVFTYYEQSGNTWSWSNFLRDPAAWYHLVLRVDTTQGDNADRMRLYINGVLANPEVVHSISADDDLQFNQAGTLYIGRRTASAYGYWEGCMSHLQFVDGASLAPTEFGESDSTSGMWKIKTAAYATPGTNGYFLKMEDRTNLDLDSSSNAFTFTTSGNLTATYDNPSNNFCTMNSLDNYYWAATLSSGNLAVVSGSNETFMQATLGLSSGKWYWEYTDVTATGQDEFGFSSSISEATNDKTNNTTQGRCGLVWNNYGSGTVNVMLSSGSTPYTGFSDFGSGDILGFYMDLDNNKAYVALNGTIENSGTGLDLTAAADTPHGYYSPVWGEAAAGDMTAQVNFGNGYFGTTVITSPTADAGGIGAFKYDPSNGGATSFDGEAKDFRAICTKNIKLYGG